MEYRYRDASEMKDSGVEWIGMIPKDWEICKVKYLCSIKSGENLSKTYFEDKGIYPIYGSNGIISRTNKKNNSNKSIIIGRVGACGEVNIAEEGWITDNALILDINYIKVNFSYMAYVLKSCNLKDLSSGTAQPLITGSQIKNTQVLNINIKKQEKIANFLNEKTSQFDSIISKKEALIEKLEEAKKSLISEVVTGKVKIVKTDDGYDLVKRSSDEMKDSGVEWLGEIPKDWEVKKVKHVASLKSGDSITSNNIKDEGIYPVYGGNGLRGYTSNYTHSGKYILIGRQGALCGNINYASNKFWASEHAVVVNPIIDANLTWLGELLRSMNLNQYSVSAAQPGLAVGMIENLYIPYTSTKIQNTIAKYIDEKVKNMEYIVNKTKRQIEKLKEAKQSLISEAVTGKIEILD